MRHLTLLENWFKDPDAGKAASSIPSFPFPPPKTQKHFFSLLFFKWKTDVQKHVFRCNVTEDSYGEAFTGHLRTFSVPPQPEEAPLEGEEKHDPSWVLWGSGLTQH